MVRIAITPILRSVVCCIGVQALTSYNWFGFIAALPQRFQINNLPSFWCLMPLIKSREAIHLIWSQIYAIWPTYEYTNMYMYHSWFFFFPKLLGVHLYTHAPLLGPPLSQRSQVSGHKSALSNLISHFFMLSVSNPAVQKSEEDHVKASSFTPLQDCENWPIFKSKVHKYILVLK